VPFASIKSGLGHRSVMDRFGVTYRQACFNTKDGPSASSEGCTHD
jgi:hypothetical protein